MSDSTREISEILGFDVNAKIKIGNPSSREIVDISTSLSKISFTYKNFSFLPTVSLTFTIDSIYIPLMSNSYEMDLEIYEKGMENTPRSLVTGSFYCESLKSPMVNIQDPETDIVRFNRSDVFFPIDVLKTITKENSIVITSANITSAITQMFNAIMTGGCKLRLGILDNTTSFRQIVLTRGKFYDHLVELMTKYGLSDLGLVAYADFNNVYIHNVNETLVGDSTPITMYYGEIPDNKKEDALISDGKYYTRYAPSVKNVGGITQAKYSSDVSIIIYPRSGSYMTKSINMKTTAKKMKTTDKTSVFDHFGLYKLTTTEIHNAIDSVYPVESKLARESMTSYELGFILQEPFTFNDFIIGRRVILDSSVTQFIGFNMTGYIDCVTYVLSTDSHNRWVGNVNLAVKCTSNSSIVAV